MLSYEQTLSELQAFLGERVRVYLTPASDRLASPRLFIAMQLAGELVQATPADVSDLSDHSDEWVIFHVGRDRESSTSEFVLSRGDFEFGFHDRLDTIPAVTWVTRGLAVSVIREEDFLATASAEAARRADPRPRS